MIVRLQRSTTCDPAPRAVSTKKRKNSLNSGAPPVTSSFSGRYSRIQSPTRRATTCPTISMRQGPASTWQCRQAWLHLRPTLIWSVCNRTRRNASRCVENGERGGVYRLNELQKQLGIHARSDCSASPSLFSRGQLPLRAQPHWGESVCRPLPDASAPRCDNCMRLPFGIVAEQNSKHSQQAHSGRR